jgi:hypothetical protein
MQYFDSHIFTGGGGITHPHLISSVWNIGNIISQIMIRKVQRRKRKHTLFFVWQFTGK